MKTKKDILSYMDIKYRVPIGEYVYVFEHGDDCYTCNYIATCEDLEQSKIDIFAVQEEKAKDRMTGQRDYVYLGCTESKIKLNFKVKAVKKTWWFARKNSYIIEKKKAQKKQ